MNQISDILCHSSRFTVLKRLFSLGICNSIYKIANFVFSETSHERLRLDSLNLIFILIDSAKQLFSIVFEVLENFSHFSKVRKFILRREIRSKNEFMKQNGDAELG